MTTRWPAGGVCAITVPTERVCAVVVIGAVVVEGPGVETEAWGASVADVGGGVAAGVGRLRSSALTRRRPAP